jgi:hypothetical protein
MITLVQEETVLPNTVVFKIPYTFLNDFGESIPDFRKEVTSVQDLNDLKATLESQLLTVNEKLALLK